MASHRWHSCSSTPSVCTHGRLQIVMSCISTNRIGDKVHFDCLVKRVTGCRAFLYIELVYPAITCSVAIPHFASAESVESSLKMACCSMAWQLIGGQAVRFQAKAATTGWMLLCGASPPAEPTLPVCHFITPSWSMRTQVLEPAELLLLRFKVWL